MDHIIFKDDEEIHGDTRFELLYQEQPAANQFGQSIAGGNRRTGGGRSEIRDRMTEKDWEVRFD